MTKKAKSEVFSFSNLDLYHFNKIVQSWKIDFLQLNSGKFFANLKQYVTEDFQLGYAKFNKTVKQEGYSPEGVWTFAFVNDIKIYWRNYRVLPKSVIIYAPGSEINAVSDANFEVMTFSVSEDFLFEMAKKEKLENFYKSLRSLEVVATNNPLWDILRKTIIDEINKQEQNLNVKDNQIFRESFAKKLLALLKYSSFNPEKVSGKKRLKLLRDTENYILDNITEPISIKELASFLNVSERTLLYAFKNRFNMGPKAYINILKLNHVHHRLYNEKSKGSIAAVAKDSGFWHMGQFYKDYKLFFGELPSETFSK